ncbi:MAG: adenylate kinase family protein [Methanobacterium sp.]
MTGTPGTGKSTVSHLLAEHLSIPLIDLNQLIEKEHLYTGYHQKWGFKIVDLDAMCSKLNELTNNYKNNKNWILVEGHLSYYYEEADLVIVLRAHPTILRKRLQDKGFNDAKIKENIEAEALDVCAFEAYQIHNDKVNEIDTTNKNPMEVLELIMKVINGEEHFPVGEVDFIDCLDILK